MLFGVPVLAIGVHRRRGDAGKLLGGAAVALLGVGALLSLLASRTMAPAGLALAGASATFAAGLLRSCLRSATPRL